jgi:hypothetical protein
LGGFLRWSFASDLSRRIEKYDNRALVIIGANQPSDLERVYEAIESSKTFGMDNPPQNQAHEFAMLVYNSRDLSGVADAFPVP